MSDRKIVPVIGLVGGIGSGKSSVAAWLAARRNVAVLDGDEAGHRVLARPDVKQQLRKQFGDSIFDEQGAVNRGALAKMVFGPTPEQRQARTRLERIVHPAIRELLSERINEFRNSHHVEAVLLDAAVLFEAGWNDLCDAVVFIDAPDSDRLKRVVQSRGWTEKALGDREASQLSLDVKRSKSTETVENRGDVSNAGGRLEQILNGIAKPLSP